MINRSTLLKKKFNTGFLREKSGYPLSLDKSFKKDLVDYKIYGQSVQNGTPTPENPIEVKSLGENSKNLLENIDTQTRTLNGVTWIYRCGRYIVNGTQTAVLSSFPIVTTKARKEIEEKFEDGKTYVLTGALNLPVISGLRYYLFVGITTNGTVRYYNSDTTSNKFTWHDGDILTHLDLRVYSSDGVLKTIENAVFTPMIEESSVVTDYKPYNYIDIKNNDTITTIDLTEHDPLRKIGDYADYIDYENSRIVRNIEEIDISQNLNKLSYRFDMAAHQVFNGEWAIFQYNMNLGANNVALSNMFKRKSTYVVADYIFWLQTGKIYFSFNVKKTDIGATAESTNAEILNLGKQWVTNNKPKFYIVSETPTYEPIDLPTIKLEKGSNVITAYDEELEASNMSAKYRSKKAGE